MTRKAKYQILKILGKIFVYFDNIKNIAVIVYQKSKLADCGKNVTLGHHCEFTYSNVYVGDNVHIGSYCSFISAIAEIRIGSHVMFGPHVTIRGGDHRTDIIGKYMIDVTVSNKLPENDQNVVIEDDVWVGANATILKGVTVGKGSVIGAGSVVTRDVLPYTIHVGTHDILEKSRFTPKQIKEHEDLLNY